MVKKRSSQKNNKQRPVGQRSVFSVRSLSDKKPSSQRISTPTGRNYAGRAKTHTRSLPDQSHTSSARGEKETKKSKLHVGFIVLLVALVLVTILPPTAQYFSLLHDAHQVRQQVADAQAEQERLKDEIDKWSDSVYVEQQARERLGYVKSGQIRYQVVDPGQEYEERQQENMSSGPALPWYITMQESLEHAGNATGDTEEVDTHGTPADGATVTVEDAQNSQ